MSALATFIGRSTTSGALVLAAALCGSAFGGFSGGSDPGFRMTWFASEDPETPIYYDPADFGSREDLGEGIYRYLGSNSGTTWTIDWNVLVDVDPLVDAQIVVTNNAEVFQTFSLLMNLPIAALPGITTRDGSVSATVTNEFNLGEGATLRAVAGDSIYAAFIDDEFGAGAPAYTLMDDPFALVTDPVPFAVESDTESFGPFAGGAVNMSIGVLLTFELSPGDSAALNGFFQVIPGPGGLAILAFFGLTTGGRRRRR